MPSHTISAEEFALLHTYNSIPHFTPPPTTTHHHPPALFAISSSGVPSNLAPSWPYLLLLLLPPPQPPPFSLSSRVSVGALFEWLRKSLVLSYSFFPSFLPSFLLSCFRSFFRSGFLGIGWLVFSFFLLPLFSRFVIFVVWVVKNI